MTERAYIRSLAARLEHYSIPEPNTGCFLWMGQLARGYPKLTINGRSVRAHRAAFELAHGPVPLGQFVCHRCDMPVCVNPDHLFAATHQENMDDRQRKGRHLFGVTPTKLTFGLAQAIRIDVRSAQRVADSYGISKTHVLDIKAGRRWAPARELKS